MNPTTKGNTMNPKLISVIGHSVAACIKARETAKKTVQKLEDKIHPNY